MPGSPGSLPGAHRELIRNLVLEQPLLMTGEKKAQGETVLQSLRVPRPYMETTIEA